MSESCWVPSVGMRCWPKGKSSGSYVVVEASEADFVDFIRYDPRQEPVKLRNRLSTFVSRFEPDTEAS